MQSILKKHKILILILLLGFTAQVVFILFAGDRHLKYEWVKLVSNLLRFGEYSYYSFDGKRLPSAYMPPLYAYFLFFAVKIFNGSNTSNILQILESTIIKIEILQALFGLVTTYFIYKIVRTIDTRKSIAYLAVLFYLFFPLTIVQSGQISSLNIYQPLTIALLFYVHQLYLYQNYTKARLVTISILMGTLILARAETAIYFILILLLINIIKRISIKDSIIFILCTCLIIFPFAYRNYITFGELTQPTLSGGYNLWRGHNKMATSDGYPSKTDGYPSKTMSPEFPELEKKLNALPKTNKYEVLREELFKQDAINNIKSNPLRSVFLAFDKFVALWIHEFDMRYSYKFNNNPVYYLWWLTYIVLFLFGLYKNFRNFRSQLILFAYLISVTILHMVFFVLPRYRLHLLPVICIYAAFGFLYLLKYLRHSSLISRNLFGK